MNFIGGYQNVHEYPIPLMGAGGRGPCQLVLVFNKSRHMDCLPCMVLFIICMVVYAGVTVELKLHAPNT